MLSALYRTCCVFLCYLSEVVTLGMLSFSLLHTHHRLALEISQGPQLKYLKVPSCGMYADSELLFPLTHAMLLLDTFVC